ncbi:hypothetical protein [Companilactobacillus hulinensis]|uniref:hypothetical protein n=1 Tax=Companilactobacillus hulinensis TaxID=2486007 RepID=UPI000F78531B|nr:hypothetical protein [Companilactobacillus hulinensis]
MKLEDLEGLKLILSKLYETLDMALDSNKAAGKAIVDVYRELDDSNDLSGRTLISLESYLGRLSLFDGFELTDEGKNLYKQIENLDQKYTTNISVNNAFNGQ